MRKLAAVLVLAVILSLPASAPAAVFSWQPSGNVQIDQPVEQQTPWIDDGGPGLAWWPNDLSLWANNRTGCLWDEDDHSALFADGRLAGGATATGQFCVVAEPASVHNTLWGTEGYWSFAPRVLAVSVRSSSPNLSVRACFAPGGCVSIPPTAERRSYNYSGCVRVKYTNDDPAVVPIADANGAVGVLTNVILTVSAQKKAAATGSAEAAGGFGDWSQYCSSTPRQVTYPLTFYGR